MSGPPFTVKAVFEYASEHDDDLNFSIGQVITVTEEEDADWYVGEYTDESGAKREGIFPRNFVERYEPAAPPRPTRPTRAKKEPEVAPPPPGPILEPSTPQDEEEEAATEKEPELVAEAETPVARTVSPPPPAAEPAAPVASSPPAQTDTAAPAPAPTKAPPPAVAGKPGSNSFRDRIAAFNKPAAPPVAPFKPGGLGGPSSTFIKKPFVAPPPSKNAFVPQPREPPPAVYRREEDSGVVNREPPVSESSRPPLPEQADDEDQPKPTSLKERIALLQKQQMEQAARLADAVQKKEKPRRPPKKRADSQEVAATPLAEDTELQRVETTDIARAETPSVITPEGDEPKLLPLASPPQPVRELTSDTNDADYSGAGDTEDAEESSTSKEDLEERPARSSHTIGAVTEGEEAGDEEEDDEEEEEVDPEIKRKMELRERMAKMSGGMGMMGMFGPPGGMPGRQGQGAAKKAKASQDSGRKSIDEPERAAAPAQAPPVPLMAFPGMNMPRPEAVTSPKSVEKEDDQQDRTHITQLHSPEDLPDVEDVAEPEAAPRKSVERAPPPLPPHERAVPPPRPTESRPVPPPIPGAQPAPIPPAPESRPAPRLPKAPMSPSTGSESDDELSANTKAMSLNTTMQGGVPSSSGEAPPPPRRSSTFDMSSPRSPTIMDKRMSRGPPPIPVNPPQPSSAPQARPPPPPPPGALSRQGTSDSRHSIIRSPTAARDDLEEETTEYEADYDTDIAPGAKFKDALKSHERDSSVDDGTITDDGPLQSPRGAPETRPPPLPPTAPRAVPPPPPSQPPKRTSVDAPRSAPPPIPPPKEQTAESGEDDDDYDPFRYNAPRPGLPSPPPPPVHAPAKDDYDDLYDASPVQTHSYPPPHPPPERAAAPAPPPPTNDAPPAPRGRPSMDVSRAPTSQRRSMDMSRPSGDLGYIATDVDLAENSLWWTQPNTPPPVFHNRKDVVYEMEESTSSKRGGKNNVSRDVYVLFADYSQTIVNARFDARNPTDVTFEQRHEPPPNKLRQDQLENAHEHFGARISAAINSIQNTTVGDGTPQGLILHLLSPLNDALMPVGTRAYGSLVYANLANASVQQFDEIRAGDIVSFRNARFQGHRGGLHSKYSAEVGKPDHVGVVVDWDGTKKKIHAWEQGRESKKVKVESFKLGDLKSGECKVWRVMPRSWVGWENGKQ